VLVIGDVGLDISIPVNTRPNYEGAKLCVTGEEMHYYPGLAANTAWLCQEFGAEVTLYGCVGKDWAGLELRSLLNGADCLQTSPYPTAIKLRAYEGDEVVARVDVETEEAKPHLAFPLQGGYDVAVLSDYGKGCFIDQMVQKQVRGLIASGLPVVVDPHPASHVRLWDGALVATPNEREWANLHELGTEYVAVTRGSKGVRLVTGGAHLDIFPKRQVENAQIIGAGDALTAALAVAIGRGERMVEACRWAVDKAGEYVTKTRN
jgi:bifunctional ADP-heptose synthase (sugar kinase/adenylyltransferase)